MMGERRKPVKCQSKKEVMGIARCLRLWLSCAGEAPTRQRALRCGVFNSLNSAHARSSTPRSLPAMLIAPCRLPSARPTPAQAVKPTDRPAFGVCFFNAHNMICGFLAVPMPDHDGGTKCDFLLISRSEERRVGKE